MLKPPIGLYGGTFAPVHNGHLRAAIEGREQLGLAEVRLLPAGEPPHRSAPRVDGARRLAWLRQAIGGEPGLVADDDELRHRGPSYTVDTLHRFRQRYPDRPLVWLVGADSFNSLHTWHRWAELFELAHIAVLRRPGHPPAPSAEVAARPRLSAAGLATRLAGGWVEVDMPDLDISSTAIRARIADGRSLRALLPDSLLSTFTREDLDDLAATDAT